MTTNAIKWGAALTVLLALGCQQGPPGPPGPPGLQGPPGVYVPVTNTILGTVTDGTSPLTGVAVTVLPATTAAATATTDGAGAFSLPLVDAGVHDLAFHLAGFADQTVTVQVPGGAPVKVTVALAREGDGSTGGPAVAVADQLTAGYAAAVTVPVQVSGNGPFTYTWTQTGGPAAALTGAGTATLGFTTRDFITSIGPSAVANARFDALGINPDQANEYAFRVKVTDANGLSTSTTLAVSSTRPTMGLRMVPVGITVWLQGNGPLVPLGSPPAPQATWSWALDTSGAVGSAAALTFATSQFPSFTPDVAGTYVVKEAVAGRTMNVYAGTWQGEMTAASQADCLLCHTGAIAPDVFTPWKATAHASALQRKIEGSAGPGFTEACLPCHTVGYDKSAKNGGFDDVEATSGWSFPAQDQPGNWAALEAVPKLGQLAGIQCESCHGPQVGTVTGPHANSTNPDLSARIKWSTEVCATCHQEGPSYDKPAQWAGGAHSDLGLALREGSVENSPNAAHCGRCHTAQGYARYAGGLTKGYYAYLTSDGNPLSTATPPANTVATAAEMTTFGMSTAEVQPPTCAACHNPHSAANPSQLRIYDAVAALPNGLTNVSGMGTGAICLTCHNSRNGEHTDFATQVTNASGILGPGTLTGFSAPHAASQGDVYFGFNAYFGSRYNPSPHMAVADTCAGCHVAITTASQQAAKQTSNHAFVVDNTLCAACHSANLDGAAVQATYKNELDGLRSLFAGKMLTTINAALAAGNLVVRAYDPQSQLYSSTGASNVTVPSASGPVSAIDYAPIGAEVYGPAASVGVTLHLAAPVTVQLVDADGTSHGSPQVIQNLTVTLSSIKLPAPPTGPQQTPFNAATANAASVQVLYKAYWNMVLLNDDNTFGVHNPGFYASVVASTSKQLAALP